MSKNLKDCIPLIKRYCKLRTRREKVQFLKLFEDCVLKAVQEMALNTMQGNVHLTDKQKKRLQRYKEALIALSKHSVPRLKKRRILLQSGTGLFAALIPLVLSAVSLLNK